MPTLHVLLRPNLPRHPAYTRRVAAAGTTLGCGVSEFANLALELHDEVLVQLIQYLEPLRLAG